METLPLPGASPRRDGRVLRREHTRRAVVGAALGLIRATGSVPSVEAIAARARVTVRTVFNAFDDKEALMLGVVEAFRAEALARLPEPPASGSLEARARRFFEAFSEFLEDYAKIRWAVVTTRAVVPDIERGVVLEAAFRRVSELLACHGVRTEGDPAFTSALRAAIDPLTWRLYRVQQGLDRTAGADAMLRSVLALAGSVPLRARHRPGRRAARSNAGGVRTRKEST